jgi:hypothetical protein
MPSSARGLGLAVIGGQCDEDDVIAFARNDEIGGDATREPLPRLAGQIVKRQRRHARPVDDRTQGFGLAFAAERADQPRGHQRFGQRPRGQCASGLFHEQHRVERAEAEPAVFLGHTHGESAEFGEAGPQLAVEARLLRRADAFTRAQIVQHARKGFAHQSLIVVYFEIHLARCLSQTCGLRRAPPTAPSGKFFERFVLRGFALTINPVTTSQFD